VAQEKEANTEENANSGKEKEGKDVVSKKEIESIADFVAEEVTIADVRSIARTNNDTSDTRQDARTTVADASRRLDAGSDCSAGNCPRGNSASRGREVWLSR